MDKEQLEEAGGMYKEIDNRNGELSIWYRSGEDEEDCLFKLRRKRNSICTRKVLEIKGKQGSSNTTGIETRIGNRLNLT